MNQLSFWGIRGFVIPVLLVLICSSMIVGQAFAMEKMVGKGFEKVLEKRKIFDIGNGVTAIAEPRYTLFNDPAGHEVPPNGPLDGVAKLLLVHPSGTFICSGSLLEQTRIHVLTAAHCVTDNFGNIQILDGSTATFEGAAGDQVIQIKESWTFVHPNWDGNFIRGNDIAVIELEFAPTSDIDGYVIDRTSNDDIGSMPLQVGYGASGTGSSGDVILPGVKRFSLNTYDTTSDLMNTFRLGLTPVTDFVPGGVIMYDFDNGNTGNDAFPFWSVGPADPVGKGVDEGMSAGGDSGGLTNKDH